MGPEKNRAQGVRGGGTRETGAKGHRGCIARIIKRERERNGSARHILRRPSRQDLSFGTEAARLFYLCLFRSLVKNKESLSLLRRHPQACTHRVLPFLLHASSGAWGCRPRALSSVQEVSSQLLLARQTPASAPVRATPLDTDKIIVYYESGEKRKTRKGCQATLTRDSRNSTYKRRLNRLARSGPVFYPPIRPPCEGWNSVRSPGKKRKRMGIDRQS